MNNLPSALDGTNYSAQLNAQELREEREKQQRREERKARRERIEQQKKINTEKQNIATINAAFNKLVEAANVLSFYYPIQDRDFPILFGVRPVLKKLLDDITPPELPPVQSLPDDGEDPDDVPSLG